MGDFKRASASVNVLLADSDIDFLNRFREKLKPFRFGHIAIAKNSVQALAYACRHNPALVFLGIKLDDVSGYGFLSQIRRILSNAVIVIMSDNNADNYFSDILADGFINKKKINDSVISNLTPIASQFISSNSNQKESAL